MHSSQGWCRENVCFSGLVGWVGEERRCTRMADGGNKSETRDAILYRTSSLAGFCRYYFFVAEQLNFWPLC